MNDGNICVSIYSDTAEGLCEQIRRAEPLADIIEIRLDHLEAGEIDNFLASLPQITKQYLFTLRPRSQGGPRELSVTERKALWANLHSKLEGLDYLVDYEADLDLPAGFDSGRAIVSAHDFRPAANDARLVLSSLANSRAGIIKIAQQADEITDAIAVWSLLGSAASSSKKLIPIAMGEPGKWTRILGLAHGAFLTYASLDATSETAPGQISAEDLRDLYRAKELDRETAVYGIIAGDTSYSMSPYLHNRAFHARAINAVFVPLQVADLDGFLRRMVNCGTREIELNFEGFSVTNPHKQSIIRHLDEIDTDAVAIGAVNTVKIVDGKLWGFNTDAEGFIKPLMERFGDLNDSKSAVIGTGGAARACAYMLKQHGSEVTVFGRDLLKAESLAKSLGTLARPLPSSTLSDFDIVVNATPTGTRGPLANETVAVAEQLAGTKVVYDLTYNPAETRLAVEAANAGTVFIGGLEMLINQGVKQFEIWTGQNAPVDEMRRAVRRRLGT